MPRNLHRRIEVMSRSRTALKTRLLDEVLGLALADNVKARRLQPDGRYLHAEPGTPAVRSQARRAANHLPSVSSGRSSWPHETGLGLPSGRALRRRGRWALGELHPGTRSARGSHRAMRIARGDRDVSLFAAKKTFGAPVRCAATSSKSNEGVATTLQYNFRGAELDEERPTRVLEGAARRAEGIS